MAKTQGWFNKMKCICSGPLDRNTHSANDACMLEFSKEKTKKKEKGVKCEYCIIEADS